MQVNSRKIKRTWNKRPMDATGDILLLVSFRDKRPCINVKMGFIIFVDVYRMLVFDFENND